MNFPVARKTGFKASTPPSVSSSMFSLCDTFIYLTRTDRQVLTGRNWRRKTDSLSPIFPSAHPETRGVGHFQDPTCTEDKRTQHKAVSYQDSLGDSSLETLKEGQCCISGPDVGYIHNYYFFIIINE